jgi:hypothetical protein
MNHENPDNHVRDFEELCSTQSRTRMTQNVLKMNLFLFSLSGKARTWYRCFGSGHYNLESLWPTFCIQFFPLQRIITIRMVILSFKQGGEVSLRMAWCLFGWNVLSPWITRPSAFATFLGWFLKRQCHETWCPLGRLLCVLRAIMRKGNSRRNPRFHFPACHE